MGSEICFLALDSKKVTYRCRFRDVRGFVARVCSFSTAMMEARTISFSAFLRVQLGGIPGTRCVLIPVGWVRCRARIR